MSPYIAAVTLLTVLLMSVTTFLVGRARGLHGVKAPATSGHPDFDRAFRVQMNTFEASLMFLPALWVAGSFGDPIWAAAFGGIWLVGRVWYAAGYLAAANKRGAGFTIGMVALVALLLQGGWALTKSLVAGS